MTRTGSSISLSYNGKTYKNENLDQKNIAVRGYMAAAVGCDLFISLHTNSTSRPKKPWSQPKSINKAYVFVNSAAHKSDLGMKIANTIGTSLTEYNQDAGIQKSDFTVRTKNAAPDFTSLANDAANENGTVIHRKSSRGDDYYGVLRGASITGVEGLLVEHAFHATQIVRKLAIVSSDLYRNYFPYYILYMFYLVRQPHFYSNYAAGSLISLHRYAPKLSLKQFLRVLHPVLLLSS